MRIFNALAWLLAVGTLGAFAVETQTVTLNPTRTAPAYEERTTTECSQCFKFVLGKCNGLPNREYFACTQEYCPKLKQCVGCKLCDTPDPEEYDLGIAGASARQEEVKVADPPEVREVSAPATDQCYQCFDYIVNKCKGLMDKQFLGCVNRRCAENKICTGCDSCKIASRQAGESLEGAVQKRDELAVRSDVEVKTSEEARKCDVCMYFLYRNCGKRMGLRCVASACPQLPSCDGCSDMCRGSIAAKGTLAVEETTMEVRSETKVEVEAGGCNLCLLYLYKNCKDDADASQCRRHECDALQVCSSCSKACNIPPNTLLPMIADAVNELASPENHCNSCLTYLTQGCGNNPSLECSAKACSRLRACQGCSFCIMWEPAAEPSAEENTLQVRGEKKVETSESSCSSCLTYLNQSCGSNPSLECAATACSKLRACNGCPFCVMWQPGDSDTPSAENTIEARTATQDEETGLETPKLPYSPNIAIDPEILRRCYLCYQHVRNGCGSKDTSQDCTKKVCAADRNCLPECECGGKQPEPKREIDSAETVDNESAPVDEVSAETGKSRQCFLCQIQMHEKCKGMKTTLCKEKQCKMDENCAGCTVCWDVTAKSEAKVIEEKPEPTKSVDIAQPVYAAIGPLETHPPNCPWCKILVSYHCDDIKNLAEKRKCALEHCRYWYKVCNTCIKECIPNN